VIPYQDPQTAAELSRIELEEEVMTVPKRQEVASFDPAPPTNIVQADATSLMAVISRAAADPNTDVDKLERLLGMYERITAQGAKGAFTAALAAMQPELPVIDEKGKTDKTTYAKWEDINEAISPVLARHGFALSFKVARQDNSVSVTGILSHQEGHSEDTTLDLPVDTGPGRNAVQAVGSSVSYGKRYTATALLNITSRLKKDQDDDGKGAGAITKKQAGEIQELIESVNADKPAFLKYMKAESIATIQATDFDKAVAALNAKRGR
jgi:hypothetical protein